MELDLLAELTELDKPIYEALFSTATSLEDVDAKVSEARNTRPTLTVDSLTNEEFRSSFRMTKSMCYHYHFFFYTD